MPEILARNLDLLRQILELLLAQQCELHRDAFYYISLELEEDPFLELFNAKDVAVQLFLTVDLGVFVVVVEETRNPSFKERVGIPSLFKFP